MTQSHGDSGEHAHASRGHLNDITPAVVHDALRNGGAAREKLWTSVYLGTQDIIESMVREHGWSRLDPVELEERTLGPLVRHVTSGTGKIWRVLEAGERQTVAYIRRCVLRAALRMLDLKSHRIVTVDHEYADRMANSRGTKDATDEFEWDVFISNHGKSLTEVEVTVLYLKYLVGMTFKKISRATGTPISTLKSRHDRALKKLRESWPIDG